MDYTAFQAKWSTLSGTEEEKLQVVNTSTVPGPKVDVAVSTVMGRLMLAQAFISFSTFAQGSLTGEPVHDTALYSAKMLMTMMTTPNAPAFQMSDPVAYATIKTMLDAIVAYEAGPPAASPSTGFSSEVRDALLALAVGPQVLWRSANGYDWDLTINDVAAAGLSENG